MTKRNIFFVSVVGSILFLILIFLLESHTCSEWWLWCRKYIWNSSNLILKLLLITPPIFLFSLITYKMRDEVFRAWWRFARWWVPVIIGITLLLNDTVKGGDFPATVGRGFNMLIIIFFYIIFIVISLVKIFNMYFKTKKT